MFESALLIKVALIVSALLAFAGAKYYFRAPDDNVIEEYAEQVIQEQTGVDIDLTPWSHEKALILQDKMVD